MNGQPDVLSRCGMINFYLRIISIYCSTTNSWLLRRHYTYLIDGYLPELRVEPPRLRIKYLLVDLNFMICRHTCLYRYKILALDVFDGQTLKTPVCMETNRGLQLISAVVQSASYRYGVPFVLISIECLFSARISWFFNLIDIGKYTGMQCGESLLRSGRI